MLFALVSFAQPYVTYVSSLCRVVTFPEYLSVKFYQDKALITKNNVVIAVAKRRRNLSEVALDKSLN